MEKCQKCVFLTILHCSGSRLWLHYLLSSLSHDVFYSGAQIRCVDEMNIEKRGRSNKRKEERYASGSIWHKNTLFVALIAVFCSPACVLYRWRLFLMAHYLCSHVYTEGSPFPEEVRKAWKGMKSRILDLRIGLMGIGFQCLRPMWLVLVPESVDTSIAPSLFLPLPL